MNRISLFFLSRSNKRMFLGLLFGFFRSSFAALDSSFALHSNYQEKKTDNASLIHDVSNQYAQEYVFYEKLCNKHLDLLDEQVQVYYKKINSIVSNPDIGPLCWSFPTVLVTESNGEVKLIPESDGTYRYQGIHFKINHAEKFDPTQDVTILVSCNDADAGIQRCLKVVEMKESYLPRFESYNDLLGSGFNKGGFFRQKLRLKAILRDASGKAYKLNIDSVNGKKNPIVVQGMVVVFNKNTEKTEIFFDFVDSFGSSIDYFDSVCICKHKKADVDKKIFRIHDHQLFECNAKDVVGFFDAPNIRKQWIPDETGFYDLKQQRVLTSLPSCYSKVGHHPETLQDPLVWVFGNDHEHDSFYELGHSQVLEDRNDYIYSSGDGSLSLTLRQKTTAKEYLTENHTILLDCLMRVMKPSLTLHKDVSIAGGHRSWPVGIYKRTELVDTILWQRIESQLPSEIEQFVNEDVNKSDLGCALIATWPNVEEKITTQDNKKWCNAAQRFFDCFNVRIDHCDQEILNGFQRWNKLTQLNVSNLVLADKTIEMPTALQAIGSMEQLTRLDFCNNNPIVTFDENYKQLADRSSTTFCGLARCLERLKKLKELHIQGLWLKPHTLLGSGVVSANGMQHVVSREVAILTGIINHKNREGLNAIIDSISKLPDLQNLSMDGIPSDGSSFVDRRSRNNNLFYLKVGIPVAAFVCNPLLFALATPVAVSVATPVVIMSNLAVYRDRSLQAENLKKLAEKSAADLTKKASLRTIHVYSPGGNSVDYFSKTFNKELIKSQSVGTQALTIIPSKLG